MLASGFGLTVSLLVTLCVYAFVLRGEVKDLRAERSEAAEHRRSSCIGAKWAAIAALDSSLWIARQDAMRLKETFGPNGTGSYLLIYLAACRPDLEPSSDRFYAFSDLPGVLRQRVDALVRMGAFEELAILRDEFKQRDLADWPEIPLPDEPPIDEQLAFHETDQAKKQRLKERAERAKRAEIAEQNRFHDQQVPN